MSLPNHAAAILLAAALVADHGGAQSDAAARTIAAAGFGELSPSPLFRFSRQAIASVEAGSFRFTCVGAFVAPHLAVTAAHCLNGDESALAVVCERSGDPARIGLATVTRQVRHPTHDVTLIEFVRSRPCGAATVDIASAIEASDALFVLRPAAPGSDPNPAAEPRATSLVEIRRGAHTIDVLDQSNCLSRGDSGTPLLVQRHHLTHAIVALLISGDNNCPGYQTFVRLDRLHSWIGAHSKRESG